MIDCFGGADSVVGQIDLDVGDNLICRFCSVSQACLRGDTTFRSRLLRWRDQFRPAEDAVEDTNNTAHALWWLGSTPEVQADNDD